MHLRSQYSQNCNKLPLYIRYINSTTKVAVSLHICVYIQILRNVILALITAHNNALNYLEHLGVIVTMDISYKKIKLLVKVATCVCFNRVFNTPLV